MFRILFLTVMSILSLYCYAYSWTEKSVIPYNSTDTLDDVKDINQSRLFYYNPATGKISSGSIMVGTKMVNVESTLLCGGYTGNVYVKYSHEDQKAELTFVCGKNNDKYTYVPLYQFFKGKITNDYRSSLLNASYGTVTKNEDLLYSDSPYNRVFLGAGYSDEDMVRRHKSLYKMSEIVAPYVDSGFFLYNKANTYQRVYSLLGTAIMSADFVICYITGHGGMIHQESKWSIGISTYEGCITGEYLEKLLNYAYSYNKKHNLVFCRIFLLLDSCFCGGLINQENLDKDMKIEIWCACEEDEYISNDHNDKTGFTPSLFRQLYDRFNENETYDTMWEKVKEPYIWYDKSKEQFLKSTPKRISLNFPTSNKIFQ